MAEEQIEDPAFSINVDVGATIMNITEQGVMTLYREGEEIGKLGWDTNQVVFSGDADASANVFFEVMQAIVDQKKQVESEDEDVADAEPEATAEHECNGYYDDDARVYCSLYEKVCMEPYPEGTERSHGVVNGCLAMYCNEDGRPCVTPVFHQVWAIDDVIIVVDDYDNESSFVLEEDITGVSDAGTFEDSDIVYTFSDSCDLCDDETTATGGYCNVHGVDYHTSHEGVHPHSREHVIYSWYGLEEPTVAVADQMAWCHVCKEVMSFGDLESVQHTKRHDKQ